MARLLVVGGHDRAVALVRGFVAEGHAVRWVAEDDAACPGVEAAGAESWRGDPDRIGTLRYALDNVTLVLWLLGRAPADSPLNGSRLAMMLERTIDTTVRGVVVEDAGAARRTTEQVAGLNEIPHRLLDPAADGWTERARAAVDELLAA